MLARLSSPELGWGAISVIAPGRSLTFRWSTCLGQPARARRTSSIWRPESMLANKRLFAHREHSYLSPDGKPLLTSAMEAGGRMGPCRLAAYDGSSKDRLVG